ncbi:MAG TPA: hypothetical protein VMD29_10840 [Terracidiphilus sp.]|nr:hypothetical protein [Terracidiphilus sp.]
MPADELIETIESHGLVTREGISRYIKNASAKGIEELRVELHDGCQASKASIRGYQPTIFNYVAGASIRGQSHCIEPECRANRVAELARFSLLYAEKVMLPIVAHESDVLSLEGDLMILSELRPLLDLGIVVPVPMELCLCAECASRLEPVREAMVRAVERAADDLSAEVTIRRSADFDNPSGPLWHEDTCVLQVNWPEKYDLPEPTFLAVRNPAVIARVRELADPGQKLPQVEVRRSGLMVHYVRRPAWDYLVHGVASSAAEWSYLSDSTLEIGIFHSLAHRERQDDMNQRLASMAHEVPLFSGISLETLAAVRRQEGDLFAGYRHALNEAISEASRDTQNHRSSREIYNDIVAPRLGALEVRQKTLRERFAKNVALTYLPSLVTVGIGVFAGAFSVGLGGAVARLIEAFGLGAFCNQLIQHGSAADSLKTDPFYFLLRLKTAHERDHEA